MSAGLKENLQNYLDIAQRRYDSLADNERRIVIGVGLIVVVALIYLILVVPAQRSVADAQLKLAGQQNLLSWMKENEAVARKAASGGGAVKKSDQPLQTIITSTAGPLGVAVKRYENESENKLRVWLENVPFDKMVRWLDQLETRYGLVIVNIAIDAEKEPGLVTAKLVLQN